MIRSCQYVYIFIARWGFFAALCVRGVTIYGLHGASDGDQVQRWSSSETFYDVNQRSESKWKYIEDTTSESYAIYMNKFNLPIIGNDGNLPC